MTSKKTTRLRKPLLPTPRRAKKSRYDKYCDGQMHTLRQADWAVPLLLIQGSLHSLARSRGHQVITRLRGDRMFVQFFRED